MSITTTGRALSEHDRCAEFKNLKAFEWLRAQAVMRRTSMNDVVWELINEKMKEQLEKST